MNDLTLTQTQHTRLGWSLFALRGGVFIVMLMWTLDKFVQADHSAKVFEHFYGLGGLGKELFLMVGALELVLVLAFMAGLFKRYTYGLILVLHAVSTFSAYKQYFNPFENLLFFAAWPMLAAALTLYLLRDLDTKFTLGKAG